MVAKVRQRCVEEGPEAALKDRQRPGKMAKLTDKQAAHIIAIACSDAPKRHEHWTLRLLADKVVALSYASSFSYEAVRQGKAALALMGRTRKSPSKEGKIEAFRLRIFNSTV